ncbi:hypothetical protein LEP1GSC107_0751 [Leptospira interrogans serovar Grippotyphosa str. UI 12769]|nr:hypothetical protein LEP1GSC107_0751 [Leptospira interrogans serovar Grippotyphosa str. UI 12769]
MSELYYGESYSLAGFRTSDSSLTFPQPNKLGIVFKWSRAFVFKGIESNFVL